MALAYHSPSVSPEPQDKPNPSKNKLLTMKTQLWLNSPPGAWERKTCPFLGVDVALQEDARSHHSSTHMRLNFRPH